MVDPIRHLLDPEIVERLRNLDLRVRRPVQGAFTGRHRSPTRGASVEFAEHEEYAPGADLRHVDWRVLGRLDRIYLKRFEERTELATLVALDVSASMGYRGSRAPVAKLDLAASLAAAFAHVLSGQGDPVGLLCFGPRADDLIPPSSRPAHIREVLSRLASVPAAGDETDLEGAVQRAARAVRRRGLVVILSDLYDFRVDPRRLLSWLRRRHEALVLGIADPDEEDLPWTHPSILEGVEGGDRLRTDPAALRDAYRSELQRFREAWTTAADEHGVDIRFFRTDLPLRDLLPDLFGARSTPRRRSA